MRSPAATVVGSGGRSAAQRSTTAPGAVSRRTGHVRELRMDPRAEPLPLSVQAALQPVMQQVQTALKPVMQQLATIGARLRRIEDAIWALDLTSEE